MNVTGGPRSAHPGKEARAALLLCLLYLSSLVVLSRGVVLETKKVESRMKWSWKVHRDSDPRIAVIYLSTGHDMIYDMIAAIHVPVQPATRPFSNSRWQALTEQGGAGAERSGGRIPQRTFPPFSLAAPVQIPAASQVVNHPLESAEKKPVSRPDTWRVY